MVYELPSKLTAEHVHVAKQAGASDVFVTLAIQHPEAADIENNMVTDKLVQLVETHDGEVPDPSDVDESYVDAVETCGHFISYLWDGDLVNAMYRADLTNMRLIRNTFSDPYLMQMLIEARGSLEAANAWFSNM